MSELKDVITSYNNLSFSDRIVFYTTISNDIAISDDTQSFLIETRLDGEGSCIYCEGMHVVKNGKRKDGVQRFLCRDCHRSFIASTDSITSRTRKSISVWATYLKCMLDQKTLKQSSVECDISISTAFTWRHKILDTLSELTEKAYLTGVVEAIFPCRARHISAGTMFMPTDCRQRKSVFPAQSMMPAFPMQKPESLEKSVRIASKRFSKKRSPRMRFCAQTKNVPI